MYQFPVWKVEDINNYSGGKLRDKVCKPFKLVPSTQMGVITVII